MAKGLYPGVGWSCGKESVEKRTAFKVSEDLNIRDLRPFDIPFEEVSEI